MKDLEKYKSQIINDYKKLSLTAVAKKYNSTKFKIRKFLVENAIPIKNSETVAAEIITSGNKKCSVCLELLPLEKFCKAKTKCGYRSTCKICRKEKEPYNPQYSISWREKNQKRKSDNDKNYRIKNQQKIKLYRQSEEYKKKKREWDKKHYEKIITDPIQKLKTRIKCSMSTSIRYNKKNSYLQILNYTLEDLKLRLEKTFVDNMSWDNYGRNGWHIDHIKPLVLFDLSKEKDFKEAWSLDNLQALWESDNCSKGSLYNQKRHRCSKN